MLIPGGELGVSLRCLPPCTVFFSSSICPRRRVLILCPIGRVEELRSTEGDLPGSHSQQGAARWDARARTLDLCFGLPGTD